MSTCQIIKFSRTLLMLFIELQVDFSSPQSAMSSPNTQGIVFPSEVSLYKSGLWEFQTGSQTACSCFPALASVWI